MSGPPPADFVAPHGPSRKGGSRPLLPPPTDTDDVPRATHPWEAYDNLLAIWLAVLALDATCLTVIPLGTHRLHMFSYECARVSACLATGIAIRYAVARSDNVHHPDVVWYRS